MSVAVKDWTDALRSGKYKQGKGFLNKAGKFCCLGVLCEVAGIPKTERGDPVGIVSYDSATSLLPYEIDVPGLNFKKRIPYDGRKVEIQSVLMFMNDYDGVSFSQIADFIESHVDSHTVS